MIVLYKRYDFYFIILYLKDFHFFSFLTKLICAYARLFYTFQVSLHLVFRRGGAKNPSLAYSKVYLLGYRHIYIHWTSFCFIDVFLFIF